MSGVSTVKNRKDYTALLKKMKSDTTVGNKLRSELLITKNTNVEVTEERRRRDRLMGDRRMRYAYSVMDGVLHDRDCEYVADIKDRHFHMLADFLPEMDHCPKCAYKALVRSAIGDDVRYIDAYVGVLKRFKARMVDLQELILVNKARLYGVGVDYLYIEVHEDKWLICREGEGLMLYHNNYEVIANYERLFREGFHPQCDNCYNSFRHYVNIMCDYSWEEHVKNLKIQEFETKKKIFRIQLAIANNIMKLRRRSLFFNYYRILSWGDEASECCKKRGLKLNMVEREDVGDGYVLVDCKVWKWDAKAFMGAMDALKEKCLESSHWDYVDKCEEYIEQ